MSDCTPGEPCLRADCEYCTQAQYLAHLIAGGPVQGEVDYREPTPADHLVAQLLDSAGLDGIPPPEPLIPGILYKDSASWLFGEPGCGKSFMAIDIAGCIGSGEIWQGYGPAVKGVVLYLVAEGVTGIKQRVRAWEQSMGHTMDGVWFLPVAVQASNEGQWAALVEAAASIGPALIVLDTQARVTVGMEENSNTEMGRFVHKVEQLRKGTRACVLVVHHTGRNGEHMRGAIAIDGAATTVIKVEKAEEILTVTNTKQKDAPPFDAFRLRLVGYGESAILSLIWGAPTVDIGQPAVRRMLGEWWDSHETDWVSRSLLVEEKIVSKPTFHRAAKPLENRGVIETKGDGSTRRYRLTRKPEFP